MKKVQSPDQSSKFALTLVEKPGEEPRVDSRIVAEGLGIKHRPLFALIRKHLDRLESKDRGKVIFEKTPLSSGQSEVFACLNERHCTLLLTMVRNSEQALDLKDRLEVAFSKYKAHYLKTAKQQGRAEWHQIRESGKAVHKQAMGQVDRLAKIAQAEGSKNWRHLFGNFNKMTNKKLGIKKPPKGATRDSLDAETLALVEQVQLVQAGGIVRALSAGVQRKDVYYVVQAEVEALNVARLSATQQGQVGGESTERAS